MTNQAYRAILQSYFAGDNRALKRFVQDRNNGLCEINLVRARQHLRKGEYTEAFEILKSIAPDSDFIRGEVAMLKASVHSYYSRWEEAIAEGLTSLRAYSACADERGLFLSNYNLSVYYGRLGIDQASLKYLNESEAWTKTSTQKSLVYRAKACALSRESKFLAAITEIERALDLREDIDPVDLAALMNVAADIYFRAGQTSSAMELLEEFSQSKAIRDKARVRFDLLVMRALVKQEKQLVPNSCPEGIKDNEEYMLRWEVLSSLQCGERVRAQSAWSKLVALFPLRFKEGFEVVVKADEAMLFMKALKSLQRVPQAVSAEPPKTDSPVGKADELLRILQSASSPLRKEDLIEQLWRVSYEPKFDNRFYKLMSRLRNQGGVKVNVVLNTYRLVD